MRRHWGIVLCQQGQRSGRHRRGQEASAASVTCAWIPGLTTNIIKKENLLEKGVHARPLWKLLLFWKSALNSRPMLMTYFTFWRMLTWRILTWFAVWKGTYFTWKVDLVALETTILDIFVVFKYWLYLYLLYFTFNLDTKWEEVVHYR